MNEYLLALESLADAVNAWHLDPKYTTEQVMLKAMRQVNVLRKYLQP